MLGLPFHFGPATFRRLLAYDAVTQRLHHQHAPMPHWYLAAIGVEPAYQGRGLGSALMRPILNRADGQHVACYLETHREDNVRLYERHGLLTPSRSDGGTRRYSADDLARLRRISELVAAGVNLAGIARILDLQDDNAALLAANRATTMKIEKSSQPQGNGA